PLTKNTKSIWTTLEPHRGQSPERGETAQPEIRRLQEPAGRAMLHPRNWQEVADDCPRGCVSIRVYVDRRRQAGDGGLAGATGSRGEHRFLLRVHPAIQRSSGAVAALPRARARRARGTVERFRGAGAGNGR